MFQDIQIAIHHIVSLMTFGIKQTTSTTSFKNKYNSIEEVQTIINNNMMDNQEKTTQLQQILTEYHEQQKTKNKIRHK